jgi:hypothetical protein
MTPQAWARGPDCLIVQPCSSAYRRASRMCLFGWSAIGVSALLATGVCGTAIIPPWHDPARASQQRAEDVAQVLKQVASGMAWEAIVEEWRGSVSTEAIAEAVRLAMQAFIDHADAYIVELTSA